MKIIVKTLLCLGLASLLTACKNDSSSGEQSPVVKTTQAQYSDRDSRQEFPFITKPFRSSELSFRVGGPIDRFEVYAGNFYKQGNIIAEIDPRDFRIRKERAEAIYTQAKAEFERISVLFEKNNISASTYEKAKADYTSAKAAFETATNELNDTRLIAPFNGYAGETYIEKYQDVKASQPILSFINIDQLKIEAYVTQEIAFSNPALETVSLEFDAMPGRTYQAKVIEISKSTTANNLSYLLTALLPNTDRQLLAGMSGKLYLTLSGAAEPVVTIPQTALCHRPIIGDYVWVVNPDTKQVRQQVVTCGPLLPDGRIAITHGLQTGDTIATSNLRFLSDGMAVRITENN